MSDRALLDLILSRRSAAALAEPGPSPDQLQQILGAAGAVPDHGLLRPFRFVVADTPAGRAQFGEALAQTALERMPDMPEGKLAKLREKANRSPTLVVLVSSPKPGKIELWEQSATASCAGYAVVLAAHALGVGAVWKSVPFTRGKALSEALGLADEEEMLGWIHLGRATREDELPARAPLPLAEIASVLDGVTRKPLTAR